MSCFRCVATAFCITVGLLARTVDDCLQEPGTWDYSKNGSQNGDDVGVDLLGSRN